MLTRLTINRLNIFHNLSQSHKSLNISPFKYSLYKNEKSVG